MGLCRPFSLVQEYFTNDLTLVNLEGVFTESNAAVQKAYRFKGPPEYTNILTLGSVEMVSLGNNHSRDYGETGYADTVSALSAAGISYTDTDAPAIYQMGDLLVGVVSAYQPDSEKSPPGYRIAGTRAVIS